MGEASGLESALAFLLSPMPQPRGCHPRPEVNGVSPAILHRMESSEAAISPVPSFDPALTPVEDWLIEPPLPLSLVLDELTLGLL